MLSACTQHYNKLIVLQWTNLPLRVGGLTCGHSRFVLTYINFLKKKSKFQQYKSAGNKILYHILQLNSFVPVIWQEICLPFSTLFFFNSTYFPKIPPISLKFHENRWNVKKKESPISGFESVVVIRFSTESQNRIESRGHFLWCDIWRNILMYEGMAPAFRETKFDWFLSQKIK